MPHKNFLFVINPIAGGMNKNSYVADLKNKFSRQDACFEIIETTGENDRDRVIRKIEECSPEVVVAVGGDGTCNLVADIIKGKNFILGIVPFGSANGLATELTIPQNTNEATNLLFAGKEIDIDAILINKKHLCIHLSDIGLNARVVKRFEKDKGRGMWGYFKQFVGEMIHLNPKKFKFKLKENRFKRKAHMVVIANASKYGTGAIVNPAGKINDGLFEVCIIKPFPPWAFFSIFIALFRGTIKASRYVKIFSCRKIRVFNKFRDAVQVDGEVIGEPEVVDAEILKDALKVIVPVKFIPGEPSAP